MARPLRAGDRRFSATEGRSMLRVKRSRRLQDVLLTAAINAVNAPPTTFFYGGQAVIEGVLMRGRRHYAVAARKPDGEITVFSEALKSRVYTSSFWSRAFARCSGRRACNWARMRRSALG